MPRAIYAHCPSAPHGSFLHRIRTFCGVDWRISAYSLLIFSIFLIFLSNPAQGDDLTGLSQDDPKDLLPAPPVSRPQPIDGVSFLPLPSWSRGATMPPLPYQLRPDGKKVTPPLTPAPVSLAPPKDTPPLSPAAPVSTAKPAPAPVDQNPALIAVSPFLQWIKSNPQAAAIKARQQADSYHVSSASEPGPAAGAGSTGACSHTNGTTQDPYWLPPLIDSADFGPSSAGGSAAIYSTPRR